MGFTLLLPNVRIVFSLFYSLIFYLVTLSFAVLVNILGCNLPSLSSFVFKVLTIIRTLNLTLSCLCYTYSLMESFVPFGGLFSTPSDLKSPLGVSYQCPSRCHLCNEKCEQEVSAFAKGGFAASVAEQYQSSLPPWLQMTELSTNRALDTGGLFFLHSLGLCSSSFIVMMPLQLFIDIRIGPIQLLGMDRDV